MTWLRVALFGAMESMPMFCPIFVLAAVVAQVASPQVEWKPFPSAKGKYSVSLPGKPIEKKRVLAVAGKTLDLYSSTARKGFGIYTVSYADMLGADSEATLKAAQADAVTQAKGELKDEKAITLGDFSGREITIEIPKKVVAGGAVQTMKIYAISGRLYEIASTVTANVPAAKVDALVEESSSFFDSFKPTGVKIEVAKEKSVAPKPVGKPKTSAAVMTKPAAPGARKPDSTGSSIMGSLTALNPFAAKPAAAPSVDSKAPAVVLGPEWKAFTPPDKSLTILLPGVPQEKKLKLQMPTGPVEYKYYHLDRGQNVEVSVFAIDFPTVNVGVTADAILEGSKNGMLKQIQGSKLTDEKKIEFLGMKGLELVVDVPAGKSPVAVRCRARIFFNKKTLYQILVVQPQDGDPPIKSGEIEKLFDSLKIPGLN